MTPFLAPPGLATEAIQVELHAPATCGDAPAFFGAIQARSPRVRPSGGDPRERRFAADITESALGFEGRLRVVDPAGQNSERTLSAETCPELIEALALIAALAIDPDSAVTTGELPAAEAPASSAVASPAENPAPERREPAAPPPSGAKHTPPPLTWLLGASAGVDLVFPDSLFFPIGGLTLEADVNRKSGFSPSVRVALRTSLEATLESESGSASFALTTLRLEVCPLRAHLTDAVRLFPCAVMDGGVLRAQGNDVQGAQTHVRPWWAAGLGGRLAIGRSSPRVDLEAGALVPLYRDEFRFTPDEFVYSATGPAFFAGVGIGFVL